jgi:tetratricopeptide (TPR) repeat protein
VRDEFPKHLKYPLVLWVNDWVLQRLSRLAPDFRSWGTVIEFDLAIADLVDSLRDHTNRVFARILDSGDEYFSPNWVAAPPANSLRRTELEFALNRITNSGQPLDPALRASIDFLLGQEAHTQAQLETARQYYERSLEFWQSRMGEERGERKEERGERKEERGERKEERGERKEERGERREEGGEGNRAGQGSGGEEVPLPPFSADSPPTYPPIPYTLHPAPHTERAACVLVHLGLLWRSNAVLQRAIYEPACRRAHSYFQQSRELFEHINRQDLVAKFITAEAEVLQKLGQWPELGELARKALVLHKLYRDLVRQARDHGFLAEVGINYAKWAEAKHHLEAARRLLDTAEQILADHDHPHPHLEASLDIAHRYHSGWYLLLLAKAEAHLGQRATAIAHLETARDQTYPKNDPQLYIQILQFLEQAYFDEKHYREAFRTKQLRRSLEQQFGFRAFVGALRLEPQQTLALPDTVDAPTLLAQEIAASGRQQDVNRLIARLQRRDYKLTVIHGPSGVGKSSIVSAGLVPALRDRVIGDRIAVPIVVDRYTDWQAVLARYLPGGEVGKKDAEAEGEESSTPPSPLPPPSSPLIPIPPSDLLSRLQQATSASLLPVLIFDQFEEFFFVYETISKRRLFYNFLSECINLDYVKVILSLREDYLHYLLEFQRLTSLDILNNDILSKDIRYPLGDFTPEEARSVIKSLTARAQFYLDDDLVEALVDDLAEELGTIRPIELQVVGAQLQAEGITTLAAYRQKGPKEKLVERSLEVVVRDCGPENEDIARILLFLLTNENGTRPLKTRDDLEADLVDLGMTHDLDKLDLVLEVLVGSGLVFEIPQSPANLYQLVHDYLVSFIRQQYRTGLVEELERERDRRKQAEEKGSIELQQQLTTEEKLRSVLEQRLQMEQERHVAVKQRLHLALTAIAGLSILNIVLAILAIIAAIQKYWRTA